MKRTRNFLATFVMFSIGFSAAAKKSSPSQEKDLYEYNNTVANIMEAEEPRVTENYIVFSHPSGPRFVGIAFDFEDYRTVHRYERHVLKEIDGSVKKEVLFYILERPRELTKIHYRLVVDGLWTQDFGNRLSRYDENTGLTLSVVDIGEKVPEVTDSKKVDGVKFIYRGESGHRIRLGGTFTSWDSWIYELTETAPGFYEITLPLPRGKYYYNYFIGMSAIVDRTNPERAYTDDGRTVSVVTVN